MSQREKLGIVLFQLGGPDSPEAVEPFLHNLFLDPDIIDFPFAKLARPVLAKLMAASRAKKVAHGYESLGGCSPIVTWTRRQAELLENELRSSPETSNARVVVAMRYWKPFTEEAIAELVRAQVTEIVLLPLYPQYSKTTTGSSYNEWMRHFPSSPLKDVPSTYIRAFHDHTGYVDCFVAGVNETLKRFPSPQDVHLVFSAHGIPNAVVQSGDPYKEQIEETTRLVLERGKWNLLWTLCWQSKVGSGRWIQPSIHETVPTLAAQGTRNLLVVPISFVSDHIETIHEIGEEVRAEANAAGVERFELMPGLNDAPAFIAALADLVHQHARNSQREAQAAR